MRFASAEIPRQDMRVEQSAEQQAIPERADEQQGHGQNQPARDTALALQGSSGVSQVGSAMPVRLSYVSDVCRRCHLSGAVSLRQRGQRSRNGGEDSFDFALARRPAAGAPTVGGLLFEFVDGALDAADQRALRRGYAESARDVRARRAKDERGALIS
jgi:hypothetical protein